MREIELEKELERIRNDESYARTLTGIPEGKLTEDCQQVFDYYRKELTENIEAELNRYRSWNKKAESGVPKRYAGCCFGNYHARNESEGKWKQSVIDFVETEENDGVLLMTGARGTGKTHLGVSAVRALKGHYVNMEDLIYKVESSLNFKSPQTEEEIFKFYTEVDFLVIDEIGRSLKREKETEILSYILRKRYDNQLPVIVISNLDKEVLVKMLGGAVKDRLDEVAVSIEFKGDSYRILKRKAA